MVSLLVLAPVVLAIGCGSTPAKAKAYSARDVERAFYQAGIPFQKELVRQQNPFIRPEAGSTLATLPLPGGSHKHLRAFLVQQNAATFSMALAYVFDSKKSVDAALGAHRLSKWLGSNFPAIRVQKGNVIILAAPQGNADFARRVRRAIASLG